MVGGATVPATMTSSLTTRWLYRPCSRPPSTTSKDADELERLAQFIGTHPGLAEPSSSSSSASEKKETKAFLSLADKLREGRRPSSRRRACRNRKRQKRERDDSLDLKQRYHRDYFNKCASQDLLWSSVYRPRDSKACERVSRWLQGGSARDDGSDSCSDFLDDEEGLDRRACLLSGPVGCGKTSAIGSLACGSSPLFVPPEIRSGSVLRKKIMEATQSGSVDLIVLEEIDIRLEEDRGGFLSALSDILRTTKRPVILTCNETKRVPPCVLDSVDVIDFAAPTLGALFTHCALVLLAQSIRVDWTGLLEWLQAAPERDYRRSVNALQLNGGLSAARADQGDTLETLGFADRASQIDTWNAFKGGEGGKGV